MTLTKRAWLRERRVLDMVFAGYLHCLALVGTYCPAVAADVPLTGSTVLRFADVREAKEALTKRDDFIAALSPFDRQVRLKSVGDVSEQELLAYIPLHVLPWTPADQALLTPLIESMAGKLKHWKLNLPPVIWLVKTDGQEDSRAAYCRGPAIVLPANMLANKRLDTILPHELFHVLSNQNPELRQTLYNSIGFRKCNEVPLPGSLAARKITNPDAPLNNQYITVVQNGRRMELMPVLFSKAPKYDAARGGTLFAYLEFKLMALENDNGVRGAALVDGKPVLIEPSSVPGFAEQVGANTDYIIHPEEILADNFVFLLNGRVDLPSQRVVQEMGRILQEAGEAR